MVSYIDLVTIKSKSAAEQKKIIQAFASLNYDAEKIRTITKVAERVLAKPVDGSTADIIKLWVLAVFAADIGTVMYPPFREEYLRNLERVCEDLKKRYRDVLRLSVKGDEMAEWFREAITSSKE